MSIEAVEYVFKHKGGLTNQPLLVLLAIAHHHNSKTGQCNPSRLRLAKLLGVSSDSIKGSMRAIRDEINAGGLADFKMELKKDGLAGYSFVFNVDSLKPPAEKTEQEKKDVISDIGFDNFWEIYPRKVARKKCFDFWKSNKISMGESTVIIQNIAARLNSEWKNKELKYIPHPYTFLHQERWCDPVPQAAPANENMNWL